MMIAEDLKQRRISYLFDAAEAIEEAQDLLDFVAAGPTAPVSLARQALEVAAGHIERELDGLLQTKGEKDKHGID